VETADILECIQELVEQVVGILEAVAAAAAVGVVVVVGSQAALLTCKADIPELSNNLKKT
jgi:hypothetical protein